MINASSVLLYHNRCLFQSSPVLLFLIQNLKAGILADKLRNNIFHGRHNLHLVISIADLNQLLNTLPHFIIIILAYSGNHNFFVISRFCQLPDIKQFLIQLLAMA